MLISPLAGLKRMGGQESLVGGSNRTIALQPLSVQGQAGLNLAVGVSQLRLSRAK